MAVHQLVDGLPPPPMMFEPVDHGFGLPAFENFDDIIARYDSYEYIIFLSKCFRFCPVNSSSPGFVIDPIPEVHETYTPERVSGHSVSVVGVQPLPLQVAVRQVDAQDGGQPDAHQEADISALQVADNATLGSAGVSSQQAASASAQQASNVAAQHVPLALIEQFPPPFTVLMVTEDIVKAEINSDNSYKMVKQMVNLDETLVVSGPHFVGKDLVCMVQSMNDPNTRYKVIISEKGPLSRKSKSDVYKNFLYKCQCKSKMVGLTFHYFPHRWSFSFI